MKINFLKSATLATTLLITAGGAYAQDSTSTVRPFAPLSAFRTWTIGLNAGVLAPTVFFGGQNDFTNWETNLGYGAYIKGQIMPAIGIRADFLRGKIAGNNDKDLGTGGAPNRPNDAFKTNLNWSFTLNSEFTVANFLIRDSKVQPYVSIGAGLAAYTPKITPAGTTGLVQYNTGDNIHELIVPVGAGVKFGLSRSLNLDLGYTANFIDGDNFDGSYVGTKSDRFSYGHAGLEFVLGNSSKPQLAGYNPIEAVQYDYLAANASLKNDLNAQLEAERAKNAAQLAELQKLKADVDADGVSDYFDKCPGTPAGTKVDGSGCPLPVPEAKPADTNIYITESDRKIVTDAIKNLEFDSGKATIRAKSFASLNLVADLLVTKNFSLKLAGHTDDVGSDEANLRLSKARAESIRQYLVSKGANASRIEAIGYGENQPIATNKTAAGRQQNRRVEFTLY